MRAEIVLARHGETTGQSSIRLYGATDVPLSPLGIQQIERVAAALAADEEAPTTVLASPLGRSRAAAEIVAARLQGAAPVTVVPEFTEVDFGAWEGLTVDEVALRDPEAHAGFHAGGLEFTYPGGESRRAFWDRVQAGAHRVLAPVSTRVVAVLHKGVIKAVIAALTGLSHAEASALPVSLGGIYRLRSLSPGRWDIHVHNATEHLGELDVGG